MITVARVLTFLAGAAVVGATLASAVKTVVVPRAESSLLQRWVFVTLRKPFDWRIDRAGDWEAADRIMARFAPFALILLPGVWVACVLVGFAGIHWAMEADGWDRAFEVSGSSLLTLGFAFDHGRASVVATFVEATIGLGLIALLISFLPTIYQQFSRREVLVSHLAARGGTPPTPLALFRRAKQIGWIDELEGFWTDWEHWFAEVEESHTSYMALPFFRSPNPARSWVTAAGAVLDSAALRASTMDKPRSWRAELCLRSGYLALRRIADNYDVAYDDDPAPTDPISITRDEYDQVVEDLAALGVPIRPDRDQAWRDFAGWRVNYDTVLLALCGLLMAPYAPWSSDRGLPYRVRLVVSRRRRLPAGRAAGEPAPAASLGTA
ncbi:MAG TPA: hypothetical protein VE623_02055 [Acidimicrobiales bacterium]|nr:hypothetical protein [Acidimicrobiales bacterium]